MRFGCRIVSPLLIALSGVVGAQTGAPVEYVETTAIETTERASIWGLSAKEWERYGEVMQNRRGAWSPGLDPLTALGVSAETAADRQRFAELYVRTEFERTRQELAFQLAVDSAWSRLYPDTPRLNVKALASVGHEPPSRYALIVAPDCDDCTTLLRERLHTLANEAQEGVDVHVVGTADNDEVLRDWIATQPELLAALKRGRVTASHGNQFQDLSRFPAIYSKTRSGQWTREL